jgi:ADP-ribose pyrophosphatase
VSEEIFAKGKLFELIHLKQDDGRVFEVARRAPGVRLIIHDEVEQRILLTREFRHELSEWDYRLPGGKVFDSLDEFEDFRTSGGDIVEAAKTKAIEEAQQEAGVEIADLKLYRKSVLGATVEWDLYIFETNDWQLRVEGQELEVGEKIDADQWFGYEEVQRMILDGAMQEERIALILLQWLFTQGTKFND